jgi:outer membrane protein OmpA-like peptidoglycan-associated protein
MTVNKKRLQRVLRICSYIFVWVFFLYTLIGFVIIPFSIKWFIEHKAPAIFQHSFSIQKVFFNPYSHRLRLHKLEIKDPSGLSLMKFNYLDINVRFYELIRKKYQFRYVILDGFFANIIIDPDGKLNLLNLMPEDTTAPEIANLSTAAPNTVKSNINPQDRAAAGSETESGLPEVLIDYLTISNSGVYIRDENPQRPFEQALKPINVKFENLNTIPDNDSLLKADFSLLNGGNILVESQLTINPFKLTVNLSVKDVALSPLQPFIDEHLKITLADGLFYMNALALYDSAQTATENFAFKGDFGIASLQLTDASDPAQTLISWKDLSFSQVEFLLNQNQLRIGTVKLEQPYSPFVFWGEGHNFQSIFPDTAPQDSDEPQKTGPAQDDASESARDETASEDLAPDVQGPLSQLLISAEEFIIEQGCITFTDQSVTPVFQAELDQLNVRLKGLSNQPDDTLDFSLTALLNETGNLDISGSVKPLQKPLDLDMSVLLKGYAMEPLTSYVGKFAGYQVDHGKVQVKIQYDIVQDQIKADHDILVKNFAFGDKVESEHTLKVPFKLALSLLEDINNRIHITLPVNGNISDPKFKYTHMISRTLVNFFVKIVAKPFTFLASVVSGEEKDQELNMLLFPFGESSIPDNEQAKLLQLIEGLKQRPRLSITVQGTYDNVKDWWVIKTQAFNKDYLDFLMEHKRSEEWIIIRLYQKSFGLKEYLRQKKQFRQQMTAGQELDMASFTAELRRQLIENAPANKDALTVLANDRAKAVVEFLTNKGGLDPKRITIKDPKETQPQKGHIPTALNLTFLDTASEPDED